MKRLAAILVALAATGCGPNADDVVWVRDVRVDPIPDAGTPDDMSTEVDAGGLEDWDLAGAGPLTGIFALEVTLKAEAVIELESRQLLRLRLLQHGTELRQKATLCDLSFPSLPGIIELELPQALQRLLRSRALESEGEFLGGTDPVGASYEPVLEPLVVGSQLDDPRNDEMPTEPSDPRVIDEDGDEQPGVTLGVHVVVCDEPEQMYVTLRLFNELTGTVEDLNTITGDVTPQLDQIVLGTSHECVAPAASIKVDLVPGSTFRAVRVDDRDADGDGNVSCDEITAAAPALFGDYWSTP